MKSNIFKYVFTLVVIGLVIYAICIIYGEDNNKEQEVLLKSSIQENQMMTNIRIGVVSFDTINPILSKNQNIQDLSRLVFEPLLNITKDNKVELCLAKEWTKQSDTSYVVKLKENIKWHNGDNLTAKDVQFTIDKLKDPAVSSIYKYNVQKVIGVEVIDNTTIKINLSEEVPFFEYNLTFPIMSYKYFENDDFVTTSKNNNPVGTGRFKVSNVNGNIVLKRNTDWWNYSNNETKLEEIQIIKYDTMGEVYNAFKIGNIDLFTTKTNMLEEFIGTIGYNKKEYFGRNLDYISFNCNENVLANTEVRKAISYLINKQNIVDGICKGYYIANFPLEYGSYLYEDKKISYEYNVETARNILGQAGWEYKNKVWRKTQNYRTQKLRFDLVVCSESEARVQVAENIKQTLTDFGMQINVKKVSQDVYQKYLQNKNYDMIITGITRGLGPDLSYYFAQENIGNFYNEEINQLLNEVKNIRDENILKEKYKRIIEIYEEQMPYVFLYYNKNTLVYSTSLVGEVDPNMYNIYEGIGTWYRR